MVCVAGPLSALSQPGKLAAHGRVQSCGCVATLFVFLVGAVGARQAVVCFGWLLSQCRAELSGLQQQLSCTHSVLLLFWRS